MWFGGGAWLRGDDQNIVFFALQFFCIAVCFASSGLWYGLGGRDDDDGRPDDAVFFALHFFCIAVFFALHLLLLSFRFFRVS